MKEQGGRWCVERFNTSPEAREGEETFFGEFLIEASMGKGDSEDVSEVGEGDESR